MKIERDKWYLTRGGEKARVICTDAANPKYPIIALRGTDGVMWSHEYAADGSFYYKDDKPGEHRDDLVSEYVEPPKPREIWANFYSFGPGSAWNTKEEAAAAAGNDSAPILFREVIE